MEALTQLFLSQLEIGGTPLDFSFWDVTRYIIVPVIILRLVLHNSIRLLRWLVGRYSLPPQVLKWGRRILRLVGFAAFFTFISLFFLEETLRVFILLWNLLQYPLITNQNTNITVLSVLLLLPVVYFANLIAKRVQRISEKRVLPRFIEDENQRFTIANVFRYLLMIVLIMIGLSLIGVSFAGLSLVFGVLGVGIGFGLQGTVENLFAGIVIISSRPIKQGDRIQIEGHLGDVSHIKLLHTVITTVSNETLIVPNRNLVSNVVHNYTHERDRSVILFNDIQVSYASDLLQVEQILQAILIRNPYMKEDSKAPQVFLHSFDDSGITFRSVSHIRTALEKYRANSWINFEIWKAFKREGIEIPFPQIDLHMQQPPTS